MASPISGDRTEGVTWSSPTVPLTLHDRAAHIWRLRLSPTSGQIQNLRQLLSREIQRAEAFHFERDRPRFLASHGALSLILARYVGAEPGSLGFQVGASGKPFLVLPHKHGVCFNLSHSGQAALIVVARDREVGIDLEQVRPVPQAASIVESVSSPEEQRRYLATPEAERDEFFFRLWTRHESYLKATGQGLTGTPEQSEAAPWSARHEVKQGACWQTRLLTPYPGYVGAVVVAGQASDYRYFDWSPPG